MDTSSAGQASAGSTAMMSSITIANLALIAVLAILAVAVIVWGTRLKRRRKAAEADAEQHREAAGVTTAADVAAGARQAPAPPAEAPSSATADAAAPVSAPAPGPGDAPAGELTQLKGLGPRVAAQLGDLGITRLDQLAALSPADADALDAKLGAFQGRLARDRWVEQARLLARGDRDGFEREFGKL